MTALALFCRFGMIGVRQFLADGRTVATLELSPNRPYPHP